MLINFKLSNFRSFKDEVIFSLEADTSKQKTQNVSDLQLTNSDQIRILKIAMIYGANASGKSNVIRAMFALINYILSKPTVDEDIRMYEPFLFDNTSVGNNSTFEINFIGPENIKYNYKVSFNQKRIDKEQLDWYPNGKVANLFFRSSETEHDKNIHTGRLGAKFNNREIKVFSNQLLLSKFGSDEPLEELTDVYLYFKKYEIVNGVNNSQKNRIRQDVSEAYLSNEKINTNLNSLMRYADLKLSGIDVRSDNNDTSKAKSYVWYGLHRIYNNNEYTGENKSLHFTEESTGTQALFPIGGKILQVLENGGILLIDELDISLHPSLTRMIVLMFQSTVLNPNGAQIVFTSHDMTLLDRELIRRDQVWLTEKNDIGISDLFSLQDFEGIREETPFDKWYLAGKFGGLPTLNSIDSMFIDGSSN